MRKMRRAQKRKPDPAKSAPDATIAKQQKVKHSSNKRKETESTSNQAINTVNCSDDQLKLITENVTKNILTHLKETFPALSKDSEQGETQHNDNQLEAEVEITQQGDNTALSSSVDSIIKDMTGTASLDHTVMPGTATQLPQPLGLHVDANVK